MPHSYRNFLIALGLLLLPSLGVRVFLYEDLAIHVCLFDLISLFGGVYLLKQEGLKGALDEAKRFFSQNSLWVLLLGSLLLHSCIFLISAKNLNIVLFFRDFLKYCIFIYNIYLLTYLFRKFQLEVKDYIPSSFIAILIFCFIAQLYYNGSKQQCWIFLNTDTSKFTIIGYTLGCIAFILSLWALENKNNPKVFVFYTLAVSVMLYSLVLIIRGLWIVCIVVTFGATLIMYFAPSFTRFFSNTTYKPYFSYFIKTVFLGLEISILLIITWLSLPLVNVLFSMEIRLELWKVATNLIKRSFPYGIGLGQFDVYAKEHFPNYANLYVHNQFLTLILEMGALGVIWCFGLLANIKGLAQKQPPLLGLAFGFFMLVTLMTHEALGIRSFHLFFAFAVYYFKHELKENMSPFNAQLRAESTHVV